MAEIISFTCVHKGTPEQATKAKTFVEIGKLVVLGESVCEDRIPFGVDWCHGQDISCVGPDDPSCPNPTHAVRIQPK